MNKYTRLIEEIMERDGDHCSLCRVAFTYLDHTYGGMTYNKEPALVGACCAPKLKKIFGGGIYLTRIGTKH
jgi:hypothetical protein